MNSWPPPRPQIQNGHPSSMGMYPGQPTMQNGPQMPPMPYTGQNGHQGMYGQQPNGPPMPQQPMGPGGPTQSPYGPPQPPQGRKLDPGQMPPPNYGPPMPQQQMGPGGPKPPQGGKLDPGQMPSPNYGPPMSQQQMQNGPQMPPMPYPGQNRHQGMYGQQPNYGPPMPQQPMGPGGPAQTPYGPPQPPQGRKLDPEQMPSPISVVDAVDTTALYKPNFTKHLLEHLTLSQRIQKVKENLDTYDVNQEIVLAQISEVDPKDLEYILPKEIFIIGNLIYFKANESIVHIEAVRLLHKVIRKCLVRERTEDYEVMDSAPLVCVNHFTCGLIVTTNPDVSIIRDLPVECMNNVPIVAEVGFTNLSKFNFLLKLVHYLTTYTRTVYAIGLKITSNEKNVERFKADLIVLKRKSPIDIKRSDDLRDSVRRGLKLTPCQKCKKEPKKKASFDQSFFTEYNVKRHFYRRIDSKNENYSEDIEFELDAEPDVPVRTIKIKAEQIEQLREEYRTWHSARFPPVQPQPQQQQQPQLNFETESTTSEDENDN